MNKKEFLEKIEAFLRENNMAATTFGVLSNKEPNLVFLLRDGRECREETRARILDFINNYKKGE
jgi:predicted transcriptional regulator